MIPAREASTPSGGNLVENLSGGTGLLRLSGATQFSSLGPIDEFRASRLLVPLGTASLSVLRATPYKLVRAGAQIDAHPDDTLILSFVHRGALVGNQDGRSINAQAGSAFLLRSGRPFHYVANGRTDLVSLSVPFSTRLRSIWSARQLTARPLVNTASLRAAAAYAQALLESAFELSDAERAQVGRTVTQLVISVTLAALAVGESTVHRSGSSELLFDDAIARIAENFTDPDFTATTLARSLGVHLRQLQRVFQAHGDAVERRIRDARLNAVAQALPSSQLSIAELFRQNGLTNPRSASRAFGARFALSPRRYAKAASRTPR